MNAQPGSKVLLIGRESFHQVLYLNIKKATACRLEIGLSATVAMPPIHIEDGFEYNRFRKSESDRA
jgi:hypothetical protein